MKTIPIFTSPQFPYYVRTGTNPTKDDLIHSTKPVKDHSFSPISALLLNFLPQHMEKQPKWMYRELWSDRDIPFYSRFNQGNQASIHVSVDDGRLGVVKRSLHVNNKTRLRESAFLGTRFIAANLPEELLAPSSIGFSRKPSDSTKHLSTVTPFLNGISLEGAMLAVRALGLSFDDQEPVIRDLEKRGDYRSAYLLKLPPEEKEFLRKELQIALIRLMPRVARGIYYLAERDLVHCDIKPGNVFLGVDEKSQEASIGDIGFCRKRFLNAAVTSSCTVRYASKEQLGSGVVDEKSDTRALAIILYEILSGTFTYDQLDNNVGNDKGSAFFTFAGITRDDYPAYEAVLSDKFDFTLTDSLSVDSGLAELIRVQTNPDRRQRLSSEWFYHCLAERVNNLPKTELS